MTTLKLKPMHPLTREHLIKFRELLCGAEGSKGKQQEVLGRLLGKTSVSLWRYENGSPISDGLVMRRALVQIADECGVPLPSSLRFGSAPRKGATS